MQNLKIIVLAVVVITATSGWLFYRQGDVNETILHLNGRLEAARVDVSTLYPGKVNEVLVHEGEDVVADDLIAKMEDTELRDALRAAEAQLNRAMSAVIRAQAEVSIRVNALKIAKIELSQTEMMRRNNVVSQAELERRQIAEKSEESGVVSAEAGLSEAKAYVTEAEANVARMKRQLIDTTIRAPVAGKIEYIVAQKNSVLPVGGRIASILKLEDLYMSVFSPGKTAGQIRVGDEARVKFDSFPNDILQAKISYVASNSQFTPKHVETADEREKLVYKIRLSISNSSALNILRSLKGGMTGVAYIKLDGTTSWPKTLTLKEGQR